jgi:phage-related protein
MGSNVGTVRLVRGWARGPLIALDGVQQSLRAPTAQRTSHRAALQRSQLDEFVRALAPFGASYWTVPYSTPLLRVRPEQVNDGSGYVA